MSSQFAANATETIEPEEEAIAEAQASRFSQVCKVYAPIYPQITIPALNTPGLVTKESAEKAFAGVLAGLRNTRKYNDGRGFALIGHSQGSAMLEVLLKEVIEKNPRAEVETRLRGDARRKRDRSGRQARGGTFQNTPLCTSRVRPAA